MIQTPALLRSMTMTTAIALALSACGAANSPTAPIEAVAPTPLPDGGCSNRVAGHKNAYFGDLHIHTSDSFDAYFFNSINGPREAYRFAKG